MNKIIYIILINLILLNTVFNQQNKHKVADSKKTDEKISLSENEKSEE